MIVSDIDPDKVKMVVADTKATAVAPDAIYGQKADIFAPCALGGIINDTTIPQLKVAIISGGANNVNTNTASAHTAPPTRSTWRRSTDAGRTAITTSTELSRSTRSAAAWSRARAASVANGCTHGA